MAMLALIVVDGGLQSGRRDVGQVHHRVLPCRTSTACAVLRQVGPHRLHARLALQRPAGRHVRGHDLVAVRQQVRDRGASALPLAPVTQTRIRRPGARQRHALLEGRREALADVLVGHPLERVGEVARHDHPLGLGA